MTLCLFMIMNSKTNENPDSENKSHLFSIITPAGPLFFILIVTVALICSPTPSLSVRASPSQVLEQGSEATLHCEVNGPNPETQVHWIKPDGNTHTEGSGSVHLKSVSSSDAGTWKCTFSDGGQMHSESLDITVKSEHVTSARATIKKTKHMQLLQHHVIFFILAVSAYSYNTTISHPRRLREGQ